MAILKPAPSIDVALPGGTRTVVFTMGTLIRLEEATGKTMIEMLDQVLKTVGDKDITEAQRRNLARRFSVTFASQFIAGCFGVGIGELETIIPLRDLVPTYNQLISGFMDAFSEFNGKDGAPVNADPALANPTLAVSATPEPGSASNAE
jgi:hypothetical protein